MLCKLVTLPVALPSIKGDTAGVCDLDLCQSRIYGVLDGMLYHQKVSEVLDPPDQKQDHHYDCENDDNVNSYHLVFNRRACGLQKRPGRTPVPRRR